MLTRKHSRARPLRHLQRSLPPALGAALLGVVVAAPAQAAAPTFNATASVSISGTTATATTALTASPSTTVDSAGVCARDASGRNVDFAKLTGVRLSSSAKTIKASQSLPAGKYSYSTCLRRGTAWTGVGATKTFTVEGATGTPAPTSPSGTAIPTGDLPGWKQVFADDFSTPVALGRFPGSTYSSRWTSYDGFTDTSGAGTYSMPKVLSVKDGALDLHLRTEGGKALVAAPVPLQNGAWGGWTYGRYSVRFRADPVPGYKTAWLLWPDSDNWNDGEIDFPEGELTGRIQGFVHQPGNPAENALAIDTGASYSGWHTATIDWLPGGVTFTLDGNVVGTTKTSPDKPMHLVLQTETAGGRPAASAAGHVQVDWLTMYRRS